MGTRRVEALGLSDDVCAVLKRRGYDTCADVLLTSAGALAVALDEPAAAAAELQRAAAAAIAPAAQTLLSAAAGGGEGVPTGLGTLDAALKGGLPIGMLVEVAGPPGAGKSQLALTACALCAGGVGGGGRCVFVDTEGKFSRDRLAQILDARGLPEAAADAVELLRPRSVSELADLPGELELLLHTTRARLVVLDSVAALLRPEPMSAPARSGFVAKLAARLKQLAARYGAAFLITNHVVGQDTGALGNTWHHCVGVRLLLRVDADIARQARAPRELRVAKSPLSGNVALPYVIGPAGVEEVQLAPVPDGCRDPAQPHYAPY